MLRNLRNQFYMRESIDAVVTEYGVANLKWRTIRERAQALIDIAHPNDREKLVEQAKEKKILFEDQIFLSGSGYLYLMNIATEHYFKDGLKVRFRAIKPQMKKTCDVFSTVSQIRLSTVDFSTRSRQGPIIKCNSTST